MRANPMTFSMTFSADTATTHVGWRQSGSDADADHLLIRGDWGDGDRPHNPSESSGEPVLRFLGNDAAAGDNPAANQAPKAAQLDSELEMDAEVNDAAVDAPPTCGAATPWCPTASAGPAKPCSAD